MLNSNFTALLDPSFHLIKVNLRSKSELQRGGNAQAEKSCHTHASAHSKHTHGPDGTAQGRSRKRPWTVSDVAEGLGDRSHVSLCIYASMYLCKDMAVTLDLAPRRHEAHSSCWPGLLWNRDPASWLDLSLTERLETRRGGHQGRRKVKVQV